MEFELLYRLIIENSDSTQNTKFGKSTIFKAS